MEQIEKIIGLKLKDVKNPTDKNINLIFENKNGAKYSLKSKGYFFETQKKASNHIVEFATIGTLGFQAVSEIRRHGENPDEYKQLFIKFKQNENESKEDKIELIFAFKRYKLKGEPFFGFFS